MHTADPAAEVFPAAHSWHTELLCAFAFGENVSAAQFVQKVFQPSSTVYVLAAHSTQVLMLVCRSRVDIVPCGHKVHWDSESAPSAP